MLVAFNSLTEVWPETQSARETMKVGGVLKCWLTAMKEKKRRGMSLKICMKEIENFIFAFHPELTFCIVVVASGRLPPSSLLLASGNRLLHKSPCATQAAAVDVDHRSPCPPAAQKPGHSVSILSR